MNGKEVKEVLGKIMVQIDLDKATYDVGFSLMETAKLLLPIETQNMFSPFHAACIVNEIRKRKELKDTKIIKPTATELKQFH